jgi:hypothetical protein
MMQVLQKQNSDYAYDASFAKAKLLGGNKPCSINFLAPN